MEVWRAWSFLEGLAADRLGDTALPVDDLKETKADLDAMGKLLDQLPAQLPDPDLADEPAVASGAGWVRCGSCSPTWTATAPFGDLNVVTTATP